MEKSEVERNDDSSSHDQKRESSPDEPGNTVEGGGFVEDKQRAARLRRKVDLRIFPLCAWLYLLNYLDRGNIGNSKVLNEETGDDLLQTIPLSDTQYAIAVSMFALAYALFEVPSNWIMKRYVRPSRWLSVLLGCWGLFTIGFSGVQNYASVVVLRFLIGAFEAGFFPGIVYIIGCWSVSPFQQCLFN